MGRVTCQAWLECGLHGYDTEKHVCDCRELSSLNDDYQASVGKSISCRRRPNRLSCTLTFVTMDEWKRRAGWRDK